MKIEVLQEGNSISCSLFQHPNHLDTLDMKVLLSGCDGETKLTGLAFTNGSTWRAQTSTEAKRSPPIWEETVRCPHFNYDGVSVLLHVNVNCRSVALCGPF